ncbi:hypothetical protein JYU34_004387 [Plutella xylostella]|uniref:Uncharacterized protein n=1 Tax=Plutella xylostella TaxID=51655 RepID=A0ABQ7QXU2_PLUXY|nr:hypothetical protein JYU34_004387 [Plutella xylostella]
MIMNIVYFNDLVLIRVQHGSTLLVAVSGTDPSFLQPRTNMLTESEGADSYHPITFL